ncbi:PHP domain-containing protein [Geomesophilobacter sediminis]|uniref:PHP domain-containing protein n=1 Tax=Geomesophilobacter sediminis TaxID=2798584 RepID=A0A8J7M2I9_9BACT|nr:PHP domain-containing protein [Geomesophilobacter sediminis]MBJ6727545.1 PHP domain-containing protein [Geomesophilobacter sediminis]
MHGYVDLHLHSTYSDGVFAPAVLIDKAAALGLKAIAIADHDTVDGVDEALEYGKSAGVEVLPAIEFSVEFGNYHDVHLLGYLMDHRDAGLKEILGTFRERRETRVDAIVERINEKLAREGRQPISAQEAASLAEGSIGRPHIAQILLQRGYASDMQDAFKSYLIPCNVPKQYFAIDEAIATVRRLGGVAILAHPVSISKEREVLESVVSRLQGLGLDGVEAFNNICSDQESAFLRSLAARHGMIWTGGSDFHGIEEGIEIGSGRGSMVVPYDCVTELKRIQAGR